MSENNDVSMDFVGTTEPCGDLGNFEPELDDDVSQRLLPWMGSSRPQLRRRQRRQRHNPTTAKAIVSEIDSPPGVTKLISELRPRHLLQGLAFDLTTTDKDDGSPWDFSIESKRRKARDLLWEQRPYLIGSPMSSQFDQWQRLSAAKTNDKQALERARAAAIDRVDFVVSLYEEQVAGGRYFLHENPRHPDSWELKSVCRLRSIPE